MSAPLRLDVMTLAAGDPCGYDSAIVRVPAGWYLAAGGERAFLPQVAGRMLREASEMFAASIGERLHHAQWTITSNPDEVRDHPDAEMAVGQLWWAAP